MVGKKLGQQFFESWNNTGLRHVGEGETSAVMAIRPDLVDLSSAICQIPSGVFDDYGITYIWDISEITETGATCDPRYASIEKENQIIDCLVDTIVSIMKKLNQTGWKYSLKK